MSYLEKLTAEIRGVLGPGGLGPGCLRAIMEVPSQFLPRFRGDPLAEGWTNADGCIDHFHINERKGDLILDAGAEHFVVVEAKMGSGLSSGTTRALGYNQAARSRTPAFYGI